jgi:hypothetical protein
VALARGDENTVDCKGTRDYLQLIGFLCRNTTDGSVTCVMIKNNYNLMLNKTRITRNKLNLQDKLEEYLFNKASKFEKYTAMANDNKPNKIVYNIPNLQNKFVEHLPNKITKFKKYTSPP